MSSMRAAPAADPMSSMRAAPAADPMSSTQAAPAKYKVGDEVEVWSNSHKRWSPGTVEKIEGSKINVKYQSPDGQAMMKQMPESHEHLRHASNNPAPTSMVIENEPTG